MLVLKEKNYFRRLENFKFYFEMFGQIIMAEESDRKNRNRVEKTVQNDSSHSMQ